MYKVYVEIQPKSVCGTRCRTCRTYCSKCFRTNRFILSIHHNLSSKLRSNTSLVLANPVQEVGKVESGTALTITSSKI